MELSETAKNSIRSYGKEENMEAVKQEKKKRRMGKQLKVLSHTSDSPGEEVQRRRSGLDISV